MTEDSAGELLWSVALYPGSADSCCCRCFIIHPNSSRVGVLHTLQVISAVVRSSTPATRSVLPDFRAVPSVHVFRLRSLVFFHVFICVDGAAHLALF